MSAAKKKSIFTVIGRELLRTEKNLLLARLEKELAECDFLQVHPTATRNYEAGRGGYSTYGAPYLVQQRDPNGVKAAETIGVWQTLEEAHKHRISEIAIRLVEVL